MKTGNDVCWPWKHINGKWWIKYDNFDKSVCIYRGSSTGLLVYMLLDQLWHTVRWLLIVNYANPGLVRMPFLTLWYITSPPWWFQAQAGCWNFSKKITQPTQTLDLCILNTGTGTTRYRRAVICRNNNKPIHMSKSWVLGWNMSKCSVLHTKNPEYFLNGRESNIVS